MRKLTNSLIAGQFAALLLAELVFMLNPEVPHTWTSVLSVAGVFSITYGLAAGVGFFLLLLLVEALRGKPLGPAWFSFRVLTWLWAVCLVTAAALLWLNLFHLRLYLPPEPVRALAISATVVSTAAGAFVVMGLFHFSFGRRGAVLSYVLSALSLAAAVTLPLIMRPLPAEEEPFPRMPLQDVPLSRRVTLIGIEGASMSYVLRAVAEGKLPNFARLMESGASGPLRTLYPAESLAVWTSIATGKLPRKHGLKAFYRYRFPGVAPHFSLRPIGVDFRSLDRLGLLSRSATTASLRRTQPFWNILSRFGVKVGLVRWWGTYPADPIDGFVVSELFHRQVREDFTPPLPRLTFPEELGNRLRALVASPESIEPRVLGRFVDSSAEVQDDGFPWKSVLARALADDRTSQSMGAFLRGEYEPDVLAVYLFGLDAIGHYFLRYHEPDRFGDVSDAEIRKYGRVVEAYYRHLDSLIGEYLHRRAPDEILIVLSGHGMDPLPLGQRILELLKGNPHLSGYHSGSPDGLLLLQGSGIAAGRKIQDASVVDIIPTLLYLMGLPLGQDMDGTLLTEVLADDLMRNQPVTFISSYHNFLIESGRSDDWLVEQSLLDALPELVENP